MRNSNGKNTSCKSKDDSETFGNIRDIISSLKMRSNHKQELFLLNLLEASLKGIAARKLNTICQIHFDEIKSLIENFTLPENADRHSDILDLIEDQVLFLEYKLDKGAK